MSKYLDYNGMSATPSAFKTLLARSNREKRIWRTLSGSLAALTVLVYLACLVAALMFRSQPFGGFMMTYTSTVNGGLSVTNQAVWTGLSAGLTRQDFVVSVNGQTLMMQPGDYAAARQNYFNIVGPMKPGEDVTIGFERDTRFASADVPYCEAPVDGIASCSLTFPLMTFPGEDFLAFFIVPYVAGILVIIAGFFIVRLRSDSLEGFLAIAATFLAAIFMGALFDVGSSRLLIPVWILAATTLGSVLITFGMVFPLPNQVVNRYAWATFVPFAIGAAVALVALKAYFSPTTPWDNEASQIGTLMSVAGVAGLLLLQFFSQRPRAVTMTARNQNFMILLGAAMLLFPALLWLAGRYLAATQQVSLGIPLEMLMPLFVFPTAAIAYAVLQFRRLDTDQILSQSITYLIMVMTLILAIFLLILGGSMVARSTFNITDPVMITVIIFVMVLLFAPFRNRLQNRIDRLYFRARHNYQQQVEEFGQKLSAVGGYEEVVQEFRAVLELNVAPSAVFIFLSRRETEDYTETLKQSDVRFNSASPVIKMLSQTDQPINLQSGQPWPQVLWSERARLMILRVAVLAPLGGTGRLNGFVILGPSRSGKGYNYEEMRFIASLTGQFGIATERAQVIDSLKRRVSELDVLSQVGQAVNFTIEFDDLLELISAQTARLIDARCFYIALYDEAIQQLRFAFFLENDDRFDDYENRRWTLDDGLFSEVVRTGKPMRVVNYGLEMKIRNAPLNYENPALRAWMGVPLTAGRRTLGVIAVGKLNTDDSYTDEQFKIFNDIGALAATSIDKAALFTETKIRERQLTVLNDITRQLVATESNVEKLLSLIMASAVEILGSEAGSLLLTTEENPGELEFRVVIGGSGAELTGKRIKATEGIVGQVASTGKPYISNDTVSDPKHKSAPAGKFLTQKLLAVPLIAKDKVIGVLEVLNKKDGTPFVQGDSDLLTTFAGQAAVAIENARLLQMTDLQLAQRVQELESLERIDAELNRTLELKAVASITVRSAMKVLKASAGCLGIVNTRDRTLEIAAIEGYTPDEYPEDSNGLSWALDKGIIRRVMRTRQADLATDVNIDPDYNGRLTGSLSQMTLPMLSGRDINAILILEKSASPRFNLPDWAFAQRIAEHASIAVANAQLYDALAAANDTKSEFMAFAAHEIGNPLSPIIGWVDMINQGMTTGLPQDMVQGWLGIIRDNATRIDRIVKDLRDAARMDAGKFDLGELKPVNMREVLEASVQPFQRKLEEKNQTFMNEIPYDLPSAYGDEGRLVQVFTNLISNANKYVADDSTTTIRAAGQFITRYVNKSGKNMGAMVKISVIDEGLGMKPEDVARLGTESYFRSTNEEAKKKPGTGMGMKLTFGIVTSHGGDIQVESEPGKGTKFHIFLPVIPSQDETLPTRPQLFSTEPASD